MATHLLGAVALVALVACQPVRSDAERNQISQDLPLSYPVLNDVPALPELRYPIEQRREIVKDLLIDRDQARYNKDVVRYRSGLSQTPPPPAPVASIIDPERIVAAPPGEAEPASQATSDDDRRVFETREVEFDDGSLDDFIRDLQRNTAPDETPFDPGTGVERNDDLLESISPVPFDVGDEEAQLQRRQLMLAKAAFADHPMDQPWIILAQADAADEGNGRCSQGWMWPLAAFGLCEETPSVEGGDLEVEDAPLESDDRSAGSNLNEPAVRSSPEPVPDAAAIEDGINSSEGADLPSGAAIRSFEPMQNVIQWFRASTAPGGASLAYPPVELSAWPPKPEERPVIQPERIKIVHNGRTFVFDRLPAPSFKPSQSTPVALSVDPGSLAFTSPPVPPPVRPPRPTESVAPPGVSIVPAPDKVATLRLVDRDETSMIEPDREPPPPPDEAVLPDTSSSSTPSPDAIARPALDADSRSIAFEPQSAELPAGVNPLLTEILQRATSKGKRIYIVGEGDVPHLALARARAVGLALVQLGATAEIIEFQIKNEGKSDLVSLIVKDAPKG